MSGTAAVSSRATTALSGAISEQDFTTPDRSTAKSLSSAAVTGSLTEEKKEDITSNNRSTISNNRTSAKLVTPPDLFSTAAGRKEANSNLAVEDNKQVRFDSKNCNNADTAGIEGKALCSVGSDEGDSSTASPTSAQRGLVSRRGGRCGSPGRNLLPPQSTAAKPSKEAADAAATVLEFKTFRSPERNAKRKQNENENTNCNNNTHQLVDRSKVDGRNGATPVEHEHHLGHSQRRQQSNPKLLKKTSNNTGTSSKKNGGVTFSPVPMSKMNSDKVSHRGCLFVFYLL